MFYFLNKTCFTSTLWKYSLTKLRLRQRGPLPSDRSRKWEDEAPGEHVLQPSTGIWGEASWELGGAAFSKDDCYSCPSFAETFMKWLHSPESWLLHNSGLSWISLIREEESHMNYLQGTKLFPFMSSNFVFVSANWDFVYPWIVFPRAWKIWLLNYEWGFFVWVRVN